jgi:DNA mismatch repair protein MLH3
MSFHHAQAIERQTPAAAHNLVYDKHGTRVTVRNLFGNMPVRVKQRLMVTDQKAEHHRLCEALKKEIVGLLLSWQGPVSIKVRDGENKTIVNLNTLNAGARINNQTTSIDNPRSSQLSSLLNIMTQSNYITIDDWASWVPASASTVTLSVKGAISLEPSPTKHVQFISFGLRPLSSESGHNELYDQVNRLFALSSFGTIEDDAVVDEQEKLRRQTDKRYKSDGYTNRQLRSRKGVDRYPMFHLRVSLKDRRTSNLVGDRFLEDDTNLQAVIDILSAMITQWLSVQHFYPKKLHQTSVQLSTPSTPARDSDKQDRTPSRKRQATLGTPSRSSAATPSSRSVTTRTVQRKRLVTAPLENSSGKPRSQAFAEWSRIKSGQSSFFDTTNAMHKTRTDDNPTAPSSPLEVGSYNRLPHGCTEQEHAVFDSDPINKGALGGPSIMVPLKPKDDDSCVSSHADETVPWTDPSTRKTYLLNARTGCVMPPQRSRPHTDYAVPYKTIQTKTRTSQMIPKLGTTKSIMTPWLNGLLQTWDNPVFKPSENGIPQISLQDELELGEQLRSRHGHMHYSRFDMEKAFPNAGSSSARLSKEGLRNAEVVSQVDRKFILVKMSSSSPDSEAQSTAEVLVLIDQHAADERIQVESLLSHLCQPADTDAHSGYQTSLGLNSSVAFASLDKPLQFVVSLQEHTYFKLHAPSFAAWGILYDIDSSASVTSRPSATEKDTCKLSVTALPCSISERCKADPQLLISFLRSTVWQYVESPPLQSAALSGQHTSWVTRIATCPPGLVDMINSRACRSAIMFNDELSHDECRSLVNKLAGCVFPFMCAHGRPSMVPIVDLEMVGRLGAVCETQSSGGTGIEPNFVEAWKKWRK